MGTVATYVKNVHCGNGDVEEVGEGCGAYS